MEIRNIIDSVLDKGYLLSLGTVDDGGVWVADLIYVHDSDFNIYWLSRADARHSKALERNTEVAGTISLSNDPAEKDIGLQLTGFAENFDVFLPEMTIEYIRKRRRPQIRDAMEILKSGKLSWYKLKPRRIELIYEELFGHEKKILEIE